MMKSGRQQYAAIFTTEIATIGLQLRDGRLIKVDYLSAGQNKAASSEQATAIKNKIEHYLSPGSGAREITVDFELDTSDFQSRVLSVLQAIPYGETRTYGEIAKQLNTSARAVGNACRRNPLPLIIPCHRVVAANGIGGYDGARSGGLLEIKRLLLALEGLS